MLAGAIPETMKLAERLDAPVCVGYQHNDAFPGSHPLFAGPLGYNGSKAGMELIAQADVVLCLGTRLNPFSTLPGYGIDYWPKNAKIIQVDINPDRIGLTKKVSVGIVGDAKSCGVAFRAPVRQRRRPRTRRAKRISVRPNLSGPNSFPAWITKTMIPTTWNQRARADKPEWMSPRMAWRAIQSALPKEAIISSDIGNNCAIGNAYPTFEAGRKYLAPGFLGHVAMGYPQSSGQKLGVRICRSLVSQAMAPLGLLSQNLRQLGVKNGPLLRWWCSVITNGARKSGIQHCGMTIIFGTELDEQVSYAGIAKACGLQGVQARTMDELRDALNTAITDQMQNGKTTLIEAMINQELGEPFRRDAMKPGRSRRNQRV